MKSQPLGLYQALDLAFQSQALFDRVPRGPPMVCAGCARVIPLWEQKLEDLSWDHHGQLVGNERWQEFPICHWDWGGDLCPPWRKVPCRVCAKVSVVGWVRPSRSWSPKSSPLWGCGRLWLGECRIGRDLSASRKTQVMLRILVGTVGVLRWLRPCRC